MKKLFFTCFVLGVVMNSKAQTYLTGGVNAANISSNSDGDTQDNNTLISFNAGVLQRFGLSKIVDVETGVSLTGKGAKAETFFNSNDYVKSKFKPLYIEVPLNAVIKLTDINDYGIFIHAGPYVAAGVGGRAETDARIGLIETSSSSKIKFNDDDPFTSQ